MLTGGGRRGPPSRVSRSPGVQSERVRARMGGQGWEVAAGSGRGTDRTREEAASGRGAASRAREGRGAGVDAAERRERSDGHRLTKVLMPQGFFELGHCQVTGRFGRFVGWRRGRADSRRPSDLEPLKSRSPPQGRATTFRLRPGKDLISTIGSSPKSAPLRKPSNEGRGNVCARDLTAGLGCDRGATACAVDGEATQYSDPAWRR
jgi:hypothetical protein